MSLRAVEIAETERGFRVSTDCRSRPEAIAAALALFNQPQPEAYMPVEKWSDAQISALKAEAHAPYVIPTIPPPDESELPPQAFRDEGDNAGELKNGEANP